MNNVKQAPEMSGLIFERKRDLEKIIVDTAEDKTTDSFETAKIILSLF